MNTVKIRGADFPVHTLKDGRRLVITSKHGYRFSDGTDCVDIQDMEKHNYIGLLDVKMSRKVVKHKPFRMTESRPAPTMKALKTLDAMQKRKDIDGVIVSQLMITALHNAGIRDRYPKFMGFNSTPETSRTSSAQDKVVDINNWAW